ncbi:thiamine biosynthesis protein ThiF [compost metagenome]
MSSFRVGIVGCGSIGSHIANSLCDLGINQLMLIDNDILSFENVARHLCGGMYVGKKKVDAINDYLSSRLPHSKHTSYHGEILSILRNNETFLNRCDLTIVATAHLPTEFRLDELHRCGIIESPILYVWVEPYLAGAHAVYINSKNPGQFRDLFDENHKFKFNILKNSGQYSIREAGCQSTYVPYSVIEVKRFISELIYFIQRGILNGDNDENILFTWFGDVSLQHSNEREIDERWNGIHNYSVIKTRVTSYTQVEAKQV